MEPAEDAAVDDLAAYRILVKVVFHQDAVRE
jgi:hypothetical protein